MTQRVCEKHDFHYYPAANEAGWKCCACGFKPGEVPGYSPELDVTDIDRKVYGILMDMHESGLVYVSNGTGGSMLTASVADRCCTERLYDQNAIIRFIVEAERSHEEFWKERGDAIRRGEDPYERCHCGTIATCFSWRGGERTATCSEHWGPL